MTSSSTRTAPTKREQRKAATRANVLQAAIKVFTEGSVVTTPVEEVTKEAGVSKATLFFHFGSRIEMLEAVAEELFRYGVTNVWDQAEPGLTPFLRDYLAAQRAPETRLLWEIGDILIVAGRPGPDFAHDYTLREIAARLTDDGIQADMRETLANVIAAAVTAVARRAAFDHADDKDLEQIISDIEVLLTPWRPGT